MTTNPEQPKNESDKPEVSQFLIEKGGEIRINPKWIEIHPEYQIESNRQEEIKKQKLEAWQKSLEIPEDVKPGTGEMVLRTTERQIKINTRTLNDTEKTDKKWQPLNRSTIKLESLRDAYNKIQEMVRGKIWDGKSSTLEGANARLKNMPAIEMVDYVDQYIETMEKEAKLDPETYGHYIKVAEELRAKLIDEANREASK